MRLSPAFFFGWRRLCFPFAGFCMLWYHEFKMSGHWNVLSVVPFGFSSLQEHQEELTIIRKMYPSEAGTKTSKCRRLQLCHRISSGPREPGNLWFIRRGTNISCLGALCSAWSLVSTTSVDSHTQTNTHTHRHSRAVVNHTTWYEWLWIHLTPCSSMCPEARPAWPQETHKTPTRNPQGP